jgi:RIO kinase 2
MYMSRLAALKEFTFMRALRDAGFAVPEPVGWNRHTIVMELIDAFPLRQISEVPDPAELYGQLMEMILRLARVGLIHGDFNEFNILVEEREAGAHPAEQPSEQPSEQPPAHPSPSLPPSQSSAAPPTSEQPPPTLTLHPILIDFPQMVSVSHPNASFYFDRDVACIKRFFTRRFGFVSDEPGPFFEDAIKDLGKDVRRLDVEVEASGFSRKMAKELESYMKDVGVDGDNRGDVEEPGEDPDDEGLGEKGRSDEDEAEDAGEAEPDGAQAVTEQSISSPATEAADKTAMLQLADESTSTAAPIEPLATCGASVLSAVGSSMSSKQAKKAKGWVI